MYTKATFLKSLALEAKIIKHLVTQIPAGQLDWRPTPTQRSTIEVMRYLSYCLLAATEFTFTQSWDSWEKHEAEAKDLQPIAFAKVMDRQMKAIAKLLAKHGDAALNRKTIKHWSGAKVTQGQGLVEMVLKPAVAYRMQLFLHAKISGATHLTTSDNWQGKPAKTKAAKG